MEAGRNLILEYACSIREDLWRMARLVQNTAESLDAKIEDEDLDGKSEAKPTGLRFRILLIEGGAERLEVPRA